MHGQKLALSPGLIPSFLHVMLHTELAMQKRAMGRGYSIALGKLLDIECMSVSLVLLTTDQGRGMHECRNTSRLSNRDRPS